ncbi:MAG: asparagine synthase C-terminal domain-containing protein, partial [Nanoarchaeota archaeon]|nr:asparagine synthase C-terminal domain-containing protein [Nanoarchaeota archaeon]
ETEFSQARQVAEHCGTDHQEIHVGNEDVLKQVPRVLWHFEYPFSRPAVYPFFFLFKRLKEHVTVSLTGEGADELFAGYNRYEPFTKPGTPSPDAISSGVFTKDASAFFKRPVLPKEVQLSTLMGAPFKKLPWDKRLNHVLKFDIRTSIPYFHCVKLDKTSMAHSHEVREPYLDYPLVEFAMTVPTKYKYVGAEKKILLQKAAAPLLPADIVKRRKLPIVMPLSHFFESSLAEFADGLLSEKTLKQRDIVNVERVRKLIDDVRHKRDLKDASAVTEDNAYRQLLFLTNLELWTRMFIEGEKKPKLDIASYL